MTRNYMVRPMPLTDSLKEFARRGERIGCFKENVAGKLESFRAKDVYAQANTPEQNVLFESAIPLLHLIADLDRQMEAVFEELRRLLDVEEESL